MCGAQPDPEQRVPTRRAGIQYPVFGAERKCTPTTWHKRPLFMPFPSPSHARVQSDVVTWDTALDWALSTRDVAAIRLLIGSHYVDHLLKTNEQVDKVGGVPLYPRTPSTGLRRATCILSQS